MGSLRTSFMFNIRDDRGAIDRGWAFGSVPSARGLDLFWNDDAGIHRSSGSGPVIPPVLFETFETRGIAADPASDRLWWSDVLPIGAPLPGGGSPSRG